MDELRQKIIDIIASLTTKTLFRMWWKDILYGLEYCQEDLFNC